MEFLVLDFEGHSTNIANNMILVIFILYSFPKGLKEEVLLLFILIIMKYYGCPRGRKMRPQRRGNSPREAFSALLPHYHLPFVVK